MHRPETLPFESVNEDKTELSLIGRYDNNISGISEFVNGKLSIIVSVLTLTLMSFFHKAFYLLCCHYQNMYLHQILHHFDFPSFKKRFFSKQHGNLQGY